MSSHHPATGLLCQSPFFCFKIPLKLQTCSHECLKRAPHQKHNRLSLNAAAITCVVFPPRIVSFLDDVNQLEGA